MNKKLIIIRICFVLSLISMAGGFVLIHLGYSFVGLGFHESVIPIFNSLIYLSSNFVFDIGFWLLFIAYTIILILLMSVIEFKSTKKTQEK
ncbi:MAG: hypothetical protein ACTSPY_12155 [Candidatus Helarchaeota archaeon]